MYHKNKASSPKPPKPPKQPPHHHIQSRMDSLFNPTLRISHTLPGPILNKILKLLVSVQHTFTNFNQHLLNSNINVNSINHQTTSLPITIPLKTPFRGDNNEQFNYNQTSMLSLEQLSNITPLLLKFFFEEEMTTKRSHLLPQTSRPSNQLSRHHDDLNEMIMKIYHDRDVDKNNIDSDEEGTSQKSINSTQTNTQLDPQFHSIESYDYDKTFVSPEVVFFDPQLDSYFIDYDMIDTQLSLQQSSTHLPSQNTRTTTLNDNKDRDNRSSIKSLHLQLLLQYAFHTNNYPIIALLDYHPEFPWEVRMELVKYRFSRMVEANNNNKNNKNNKTYDNNYNNNDTISRFNQPRPLPAFAQLLFTKKSEQYQQEENQKLLDELEQEDLQEQNQSTTPTSRRNNAQSQVVLTSQLTNPYEYEYPMSSSIHNSMRTGYTSEKNEPLAVTSFILDDDQLLKLINDALFASEYHYNHNLLLLILLSPKFRRIINQGRDSMIKLAQEEAKKSSNVKNDQRANNDKLNNDNDTTNNNNNNNNNKVEINIVAKAIETININALQLLSNHNITARSDDILTIPKHNQMKLKRDFFTLILLHDNVKAFDFIFNKTFLFGPLLDFFNLSHWDRHDYPLYMCIEYCAPKMFMSLLNLTQRNYDNEILDPFLGDILNFQPLIPPIFTMWSRHNLFNTQPSINTILSTSFYNSFTKNDVDITVPPSIKAIVDEKNRVFYANFTATTFAFPIFHPRPCPKINPLTNELISVPLSALEQLLCGEGVDRGHDIIPFSIKKERMEELVEILFSIPIIASHLVNYHNSPGRSLFIQSSLANSLCLSALRRNGICLVGNDMDTIHNEVLPKLLIDALMKQFSITLHHNALFSILDANIVKDIRKSNDNVVTEHYRSGFVIDPLNPVLIDLGQLNDSVLEQLPAFKRIIEKFKFQRHLAVLQSHFDLNNDITGINVNDEQLSSKEDPGSGDDAHNKDSSDVIDNNNIITVDGERIVEIDISITQPPQTDQPSTQDESDKDKNNDDYYPIGIPILFHAIITQNLPLVRHILINSTPILTSTLSMPPECESILKQYCDETRTSSSRLYMKGMNGQEKLREKDLEHSDQNDLISKNNPFSLYPQYENNPALNGLTSMMYAVIPNPFISCEQQSKLIGKSYTPRWSSSTTTPRWLFELVGARISEGSGKKVHYKYSKILQEFSSSSSSYTSTQTTPSIHIPPSELTSLGLTQPYVDCTDWQRVYTAQLSGMSLNNIITQQQQMQQFYDQQFAYSLWSKLTSQERQFIISMPISAIMMKRNSLTMIKNAGYNQSQLVYCLVNYCNGQMRNMLYTNTTDYRGILSSHPAYSTIPPTIPTVLPSNDEISQFVIKQDQIDMEQNLWGVLDDCGAGIIALLIDEFLYQLLYSSENPDSNHISTIGPLSFENGNEKLGCHYNLMSPDGCLSSFMNAHLEFDDKKRYISEKKAFVRENFRRQVDNQLLYEEQLELYLKQQEKGVMTSTLTPPIKPTPLHITQYKRYSRRNNGIAYCTCQLARQNYNRQNHHDKKILNMQKQYNQRYLKMEEEYMIKNQSVGGLDGNSECNDTDENNQLPPYDLPMSYSTNEYDTDSDRYDDPYIDAHMFNGPYTRVFLDRYEEVQERGDEDETDQHRYYGFDDFFDPDEDENDTQDKNHQDDVTKDCGGNEYEQKKDDNDQNDTLQTSPNTINPECAPNNSQICPESDSQTLVIDQIDTPLDNY